jgi:hypothetical protein
MGDESYSNNRFPCLGSTCEQLDVQNWADDPTVDAGRLADFRLRRLLLGMGLFDYILGPKAPLNVAFNATAGGPANRAEIRGYEALRNWQIPRAVKCFQSAITQAPESSVRIAYVCYQAGNLEMVSFVLMRGFYRQGVSHSEQPNRIGQLRIICTLLFFQATGCLPPLEDSGAVEDLLAWNSFSRGLSGEKIPNLGYYTHSCMILGQAIALDEKSAIKQAACLVAVRNYFEYASDGQTVAGKALIDYLVPVLSEWKRRTSKDHMLRGDVESILESASRKRVDVDQFQAPLSSKHYSSPGNFSKIRLTKLLNSEIPPP